MTNDVIMSILARCLSDAAFLEAVIRDPASGLREYHLDADTIEEFRNAGLPRLADLRGFITKVKHNDLWEDFPYTRILLRRFGFELAAFRAYSASDERVRRRPGESRRTRIARFLEFLGSHLLAATDSKAAILRSVLTHEQVRWELSHQLKLSAAPAGARAGSWGDDSARPVIRDTVRLVELDYNPLEVVPLIPGDGLDTDVLERRRRWLAYAVPPGTDELRVLEIPPAAAFLLSLADGNRSVRRIWKEATEALGPLPTAEALPFFRGADEIGLVRERPVGRSRT